MGLSDDQRALLRLLAQREEGYDDIAALMGLSVDEVRARVKGALEGLDEEGSAAGPVGAGDPPPPPVAKASSGAVPPTPPPAEETPAPTPARPPAQAKPRRRAALPKERRRLWELVGGAVVVLLLVLFATGAIDIGGDDSDSDGSGDGASSAQTVGAENENLTQATLEPADGGDARGRALFGRLRKEVVLQVVADGLEPTGSGESYTIWLYRSPKLSLRVGAVKVGEAGQLGARFPIPAEVLALVANRSFTQINVSLTEDAAYKEEIAAAKRERRLPPYSGETVLSGEIAGPITEVGAKGGG